MKFDTQFSRASSSEKYVCDSGSPFLTTYEYQFDKDGVKNLVPVGKKDIQAMIDASAESVDLNVLMMRYINGDTSALERVQGVYMDVRDMPETYAEMFERNEHCKILFESLPVDIKERFNNSYTEFWSAYGSKAFMDAINVVEVGQDLVIEKESEVNNESK